MSIKSDIKELIENQVIDQQTADRITSYYQTKKRTIKIPNINVTTIISVVAAILVGFGVISIIAYNWDDIPNLLRILIGFMPWAATSFGCYYTLKNKADNKSWTETMAVLQAAGFTASFSIINQVYQVQLDGVEFTLILILASLPFVFILQSAVLSTIIISLTCITSSHNSLLLSKITMNVVLLADIAFLYYNYYRKSESFLCNLRVALLPLFWVIFFFDILKGNFDIKGEPVPIIPIFMSVMYVIYEWINKCERIKSNGNILKYLFYIIFLITILVFSNNGLEEHLHVSDYAVLALSSIPIFLSVALKLAGKEIPTWQTWIGLAFSTIVILCGKNNHITSLFSLAIILGAVYISYKKDKQNSFYICLLALFILALIVLNNNIRYSFDEIIFTVSASIVYLLYEWVNKSDNYKKIGKLLKVKYYLVFFPSILVLSAKGTHTNPENSHFIIPLIVGTIAILAASIFLTKKKITQWETWSGVIFSLVAVICGEHNSIISVLSLAIIAYCLYSSCYDYDLLKMNVSILALFAWSFSVLNNFDLPFFIYGLILIILGMALILMNRYIISKRKSNGITEDK